MEDSTGLNFVDAVVPSLKTQQAYWTARFGSASEFESEDREEWIVLRFLGHLLELRFLFSIP